MLGFGVGNIWSHQSFESKRRYSNKEIRNSDPLLIKTYKELVQALAYVAFQNSELPLYFRGQTDDFTIGSGATSIYPAIFRKDGKISHDEMDMRYFVLQNAECELLSNLFGHNIDGYKKMLRFRELSWAVIQHYEICPTPLLDVTHSLRVACSFALEGDAEFGYIFVFGLIHSNGGITYSSDQEMLLVRLLSVCPPEAHRPYFQEGYLVGTFPFLFDERNPRFDCAKRLVAKFKIPKKGFWDDDFPPIPRTALFPEDDRFEIFANEIKEKARVSSSIKIPISKEMSKSIFSKKSKDSIFSLERKRRFIELGYPRIHKKIKIGPGSTMIFE